TGSTGERWVSEKVTRRSPARPRARLVSQWARRTRNRSSRRPARRREGASVSVRTSANGLLFYLIVIDLVGVDALDIVLDRVAEDDLVLRLQHEDEGRALLDLALDLAIERVALCGVLLDHGGVGLLADVGRIPAGAPGDRVRTIVAGAIGKS